MNTHLDGIVLSRETKSVPSHRMDQVITLEHFIAAPYIRDHIASPVSYMKTVSGRIREHIQTVVFRFLAIIDIYRLFLPVCAPFRFDGSMVIRCSHFFIPPDKLLSINTLMLSHTAINFNYL